MSTDLFGTASFGLSFDRLVAVCCRAMGKHVYMVISFVSGVTESALRAWLGVAPYDSTIVIAVSEWEPVAVEIATLAYKSKERSIGYMSSIVPFTLMDIHRPTVDNTFDPNYYISSLDKTFLSSALRYSIRGCESNMNGFIDVYIPESVLSRVSDFDLIRYIDYLLVHPYLVSNARRLKRLIGHLKTSVLEYVIEKLRKTICGILNKDIKYLRHLELLGLESVYCLEMLNTFYTCFAREDYVYSDVTFE